MCQSIVLATVNLGIVVAMVELVVIMVNGRISSNNGESTRKGSSNNDNDSRIIVQSKSSFNG